jgi:curved DNA-binding protein CbpA
MALSFYDILRVRTDATLDEIKDGFDRLNERYEGKTDEDSINAVKFGKMAYETLANELQRRMYDQRIGIDKSASAQEKETPVATEAINPADPIRNFDLIDLHDGYYSTQSKLKQFIQAILPKNRIARNVSFCFLGITIAYFFLRHYGYVEGSSSRASLEHRIEKQLGKYGQALAEGEKQYIEISRKLLRHYLMDADTARFRDVVSCKAYGSGSNILFGYVNAKNAYGAYVGFREFVIDFNDNAVMIADEDREHVYPRCD